MIGREICGRVLVITLVLTAAFAVGCRGRQYGHVLDPDHNDMVGSHAAGAAIYKPLVDESMAKLLGRHAHGIRPVSLDEDATNPLRVCFIGVENASIEELGDFREEIYEHIDTHLSQSQLFQPISKRFVDAGLRESRLRPDELFLPKNQRIFATMLEEEGHPFDFLLYAKITSGTTRNNKDYQRDYRLTLELVNIHNGNNDKESALLRKGYHKSKLGKWKNYKHQD